ncbi:gata transcription factor [Musa troglodytarum]|uniref:Gata transcription factor n=1 Tax=Musa troglodytarum TaxID=320322 RepID=A0A9E7JIP1_9LILI|nr:gata transcription factor [Musa troglodytarum]
MACRVWTSVSPSVLLSWSSARGARLVERPKLHCGEMAPMGLR